MTYTTLKEIGVRKMADNQDYIKYLTNLKNRIFKILPLCEEKNTEVVKHIESTIFEVRGLFSVIPSAKSSIWNIRTLSVLSNMAENYSVTQLHDEEIYRTVVRREVFNLLNVIDKEIEQLWVT